MPNDRLRTALLERGVTPADLAEELKVDPKSVERWISGRTPYRRHRYAVAAKLGVDEAYLWPDALSRSQVADASESEIVSVRILLGDPNSESVAQRGADEGVDDAMAAKIRNALVLYRPLRDLDGIEFRSHDTVLYNSIYRADDQVLVNTHIYGFPASQAPVLHLRKVAGGTMVSSYLDSFERVWDGATPLE
jgi:transcriptional regulator with XRE-family HTH domain